MNELCSPLPELEPRRFAEVIRHCIDRGQQDQRQGQQLLRLVINVSPAHPWDLLDAPWAMGQAQLAWQDGRTGELLAAVGAIRQIETGGPDRMAQAQALVAATAQQIVGVGHDGAPARADDGDLDDLPLWLGGFAFGSGTPHGGPWAKWPSAWLFVPRLLLLRRDQLTRLVITEHVSATDTVRDVIERLTRTTAAWAHVVAPLTQRSAGPDQELGLNLHWRAPQNGCRSDWTARARHARDAIGTGLADKIVLARSVALENASQPFDPLGTLRRLEQHHRGAPQGCTLFALRRPDGSAFVGATPETLVLLRDQRVHTAALAGTAPRHLDAHRDQAAGRALADSVKEQNEHAVVVEAIRAALKQRCDLLDIAIEPRLRRLSLVQHLETAISGKLREPTHILELVRLLHPTPAVAGWPAPPALSWLKDNEPIERGWYAGPLGWITPRGDGHFVVALRCALLQGHTAWAFAGAGITERSQPEAEWEETTLKLGTMGQSLAVPPATRSAANRP